MHDYKERFKYFEYKKGFGLISATHDELPGQKFTMRTTADERMDRYRWLLLKYFYAPRHPIINEENWLHARMGIINELEELINIVPNVEIQIQEFETDILGKRDELATVQGQNIIVTFRGRNWGTAYDEILLVGSHYDSDNMETMSLNDNGSGVVAMLEVVRSLWTRSLINAPFSSTPSSSWHSTFNTLNKQVFSFLFLIRFSNN